MYVILFTSILVTFTRDRFHFSIGPKYIPYTDYRYSTNMYVDTVGTLGGFNPIISSQFHALFRLVLYV